MHRWHSFVIFYLALNSKSEKLHCHHHCRCRCCPPRFRTIKNGFIFCYRHVFVWEACVFVCECERELFVMHSYFFAHAFGRQSWRLLRLPSFCRNIVFFLIVFLKPFSLCTRFYLLSLHAYNTHAIVCLLFLFSVSFCCIVCRIFRQLFSQNGKKYFHLKFSSSICSEWNRSHLFCEMTNAINFVELFLFVFPCICCCCFSSFLFLHQSHVRKSKYKFHGFYSCESFYLVNSKWIPMNRCYFSPVFSTFNHNFLWFDPKNLL